MAARARPIARSFDRCAFSPAMRASTSPICTRSDSAFSSASRYSEDLVSAAARAEATSRFASASGSAGWSVWAWAGWPAPRNAVAVNAAPITGTSTGIAPIGQNAPGQPHNHDELAELVPDKRLTATERATLADQLTRARAVAMRYPTVADAVAAGYKRAGGFAPGAGAHY